MPASAFVHATAAFAAGAIVGGGLTTIIVNRKHGPTTSLPPAPAAHQQPHPVAVDRTFGRPQPVEQQLSLGAPSLKYGFPGPISDVLMRQSYAVGYDRRLRHPAWTAEHLTAAKLAKNSPNDDKGGDRSKSAFVEDTAIPVLFRASLQDYFRSGYDRGHMVPAADAKASQSAMDETFLLSNIAPQVGDGFNRHYWAYLEDWCRRLTNNFADVYVFTVPVYLPKRDPDGKWRITHEVIGNPPNIAVPTHFAKVILTSKPSSPSDPHIPEISMGAFVLPNAVIPDETPLESFVVPVEAVERATGLQIFPEDIKTSSKHICKTTKCELIIRRFDNARKNAGKAVGAPGKA